jgi:hypothetical protein
VELDIDPRAGLLLRDVRRNPTLARGVHKAADVEVLVAADRGRLIGLFNQPALRSDASCTSGALAPPAWESTTHDLIGSSA